MTDQKTHVLEHVLMSTRDDVLRAATIANNAINCLMGFDAWTLKEKLDARDTIKDILHQYGESR